MVFRLEFTVILLVALAFMSGVTLVYTLVTRRENKILKSRVQELTLHIKRYERLLESMRESEEQKEKTVNIDLRILELYNQGYSLRKIAKEVGLSHTTVARRLKKLLSEGKASGVPTTLGYREKVALGV